MINNQELIFAVDENNQPIESVVREKAHAEGIWHRGTDIIVMNDKNEILCNKRSMLKVHSPGCWDPAFGGHCLAGQDILENARQELFEESGLNAKPEDLEFVETIKWDNGLNKEFRYVYVYRWEGDLKDLKLEKEEVDEVKWMDLKNVAANKNNKAEWSPMPYIDLLIKRFSN
ncbi:MAG: hypothetical protein A3I07_03970 [Candidatus Doudnabacteria bacterium RIFCSPLOWO2_02_FULL_42_9]|uniref:Nudix hydrolase domain-containing protein n=1 Tax=Candidatus Doudnabacteria bacterium RIFCSPHIGHO2_01_FULL_41_86 TaxID=1817821 RepID=A0A1F5N7M6_9BACT|nr:MAG: hypothetical protein A2717_03375 [Candidatus Doudnabacteria bacterium RIFCSPHIGHO2_01_FULL_41_86]OGE75667.1 MAG: hypothetical protein A3K07_00315 [Candidatus Doudnabacteria bacterium RIFCSPHIGHO2_01_43_10]OGE85685.1 MAG: hypothetical protein A3E28_02705 [Candidatus Doudnabacteria bacterium RIFCSPHIGHO2_12_FULL_42_22]OGE87180.1 MAG: hypothetical protein A3C49_00335 [Candidatus Doudnabacteria bacterium RIFCSPHIGHO2_02_FULL_42_25]OGE92018.1 MAG: hypothetical protein A2895_00210 [Candidatus